jgi:hypothetical protein
MGKETFIFRECERYLKKLHNRYSTEGIWIVKKYGRRYSFVCGIRPSGFESPDMVKINDRYLLFFQKGEDLHDNLDNVILKLKELLDENREG